MEYKLKKDHPDKQRAIDRFKKLLDEQATVELKKIIGKRTLSQNSWLHVVITLYAIEYGYTLEEAKTILKRACLFMRYSKMIGEDGEEIVFLKQTSRLDKKELGEFLDWIYIHAAKEGCYLPDLEQYKENKNHYDKVIRSHRQYL